MRRLQQLGGQTTAPSGDVVDALPRSTISTILRGSKLPRAEFVSAFVTACLVHGNHPPDKVAETTERWLARWRTLYAAEAAEGEVGETTDGEMTVEPSRAVNVPRHLPLDVGFLVGREAELKAADEVSRLQAPDNVVLVSGPVGVGKSAFAIRWAHRLINDFPDGQLYVDLRGADGLLTTESALGVLLGGLGLHEDDWPADPWRRVECYRSLIADHRMLVVLDNACDTEQVRPLLATGGRCRTIVTSRNRMSGLVAREGARRLVLDVLSAESACTVLTAIIGEQYVREARAELEELAELCAYLPLVLRLAAVKFADRPGQGFKNFVSALRDNDQLLSLKLDDDRDSSVRAALESSYWMLDLDARYFFRTLALAEDAEFTLESSAALAGISVAEADRLTGLLESEHFVAGVGRSRFTMDRVLQAFARTMRRATCESRTMLAG
ncbi:NB-ARC domain-containing protein [Streptomyces mirabilis]|uniref:NB-ARC domain-containing protein n=1 Tax=Streptomyces mirabilis TaxID=68239 RepID=UPI0033B183B7